MHLAWWERRRKCMMYDVLYVVQDVRCTMWDVSEELIEWWAE